MKEQKQHLNVTTESESTAYNVMVGLYMILTKIFNDMHKD